MLRALLVCCCFLACAVSAKVQRLSPNEGLSQSYVSNMLIDKYGYLWLGTESGLNRYDGYQVIAVAGDNGELDEAMIDALYQDQQGHIWIASLLAGLHRFDPDTGRTEQVLGPPQSDDVTFAKAVFTMLAIGPNELWLGRGEDVASLNIETGEVTSLFTLESKDERSLVRQMFKFGEQVYVGTSSGAYIYDLQTKKVRSLAHLPAGISGIHRNNVKSFAVIDAEHLLVGTVKGLYQLDINADGSLAADAHSPASEMLIADLNIWQMQVLGEDTVLLATDKGLFEFNISTRALRKRRQLIDSEYSLSDASIIAMQETPQGDLWVGTKSDGAFFLPKKHFQFDNLTAQNLRGEGLSHHNIWASTVVDNTLYLGTHNGLTIVDTQHNSSQILYKNHLSDQLDNAFSIYRLIPFADQLLLNTTRGLFYFDIDSTELHRVIATNNDQQQYLQGWLHGLYKTPDNRVYGVNQDQGFFYFDLDTKVLTPLHGDLDEFDPFLALGFNKPLPDKPNQPLFYSGGQLLRLDSEQQKLQLLYEVPQSHENLAVNLNSYVVDHQNVLWLSFSNFGLVALDARTFELIKRIDLQKLGLGTLMYDLVLDEHGMIWMSSHKGVWRFNPLTEHFQQYTTEEGLATNEFNGGSFSRFDDGRVVYGSVKGATLFYPQQNQPQRALLKRVNITSAQLAYRELDKQLSPLEQVHLEHDDIGLEVSFAAMIYNYQDRIIFQYQLGDSPKAHTKDNNRVVFSKLNPGLHTLKVWAQDPFTGEFTDPAQLQIKVDYPPWSSPFYLTLYVLLGATLVGLWLYRRNQIQRMIIAAHNESKESEARLKLALDGSHSGVWDWRQEGSQIYQPRLREELGYDYDSCHLDDYLALIHPDERQKFRIEWLEFLSTDKGYFNCVYRLRHSNGLWRWYKDFGKVMAWQDDLPMQVAGTYTNMTRELVFEENARLFGAAFEQTSDWVIILDHKLRIRATNQALREHFNYSPSTRSSRHLTLGLSKNTRINYLRILNDLNVGEHYQSEEVVIIKNGEQVPVLLKMSAVADAEHHLTSYIIILTDISAPKNALASKREHAHYDSLTGLPNRALFMDRVEHALEQSARQQNQCALVLINIANLNKINSARGFESGDQLLLSLAYRLQRTVRSQDSLGRVSGDEFALLLENMDDVEHIVTVCKKVRDVLTQPFKQRVMEPLVEVSLGIALFPQDAQRSDELLKCADLAMYQAKRLTGSHCQFFKPEMNAYVQRRIDTEKAVASAYEQCEFVNQYQAIFAAQSQQVIGFEVLLRWQKQQQLLAPDEFLVHVRKPELWSKLFLQTLERAILESQLWLRQRHDLTINMNLSGREFSQPGCTGDITHLLRSFNFPLAQLMLEIHVNDWLQLDEQAKQALQMLQQEGVKIALQVNRGDDFCVPELCGDTLSAVKLGPQLVAEICMDMSVQAKVTRFLKVVNALELTVIAVGVETERQAQLMRDIGCAAIQGFHMQRPALGDSIASLLK